MESNTLGRILRENREKQKLSKQKVCRGLCTVMALSRYESDERIPDKFLMDALLERLGFQPSKYELNKIAARWPAKAVAQFSSPK